MSYNICLGVKVEGMNGYIAVIDEPEYSSPTYNLREMFVACMGWDYKQGQWYNLADVYPLIQHGLHELAVHPDQYRKYDPPNGWGSLEGARDCLESICNKVAEIVSGEWSWNQIPLEHLWIRW